MDIVLATRNKKKVDEIKRILKGLLVSIHTLDDFPECPEAKEDGRTFEENAVKKAVAVSGYTGMPALADDSGLEVYALKGAPGVMSARYAGENANDMENVMKLLYQMRQVDDTERGARFVCCIAMAFPNDEIKTFFGYANGRIGREPTGSGGFGYDPVFYPEGYNRTFAEMGNEEKDSLSHRGHALRKFYNYLKANIS